MDNKRAMLRRVPTPTRAKRRLGQFMAELRSNVDIEAEEAARRLKTSKSTLLRYERGDVMPVWSTVESLLRQYHATSEESQKAEQLWQEAHDDPPPVRLPAGAPSSFRKLVARERDAELIRVIQPLVVPGLVQTEGYARALITAGRRLDDTPGRADSVINTRLSRQRRLEGHDPLQLHVLLDQAVIMREIGGTEVMRQQLTYLLDLGKRPNITIQVLPFQAGAYGTMDGAITIVGYPDPDESSNVYVEHPVGGAWVEDVDDVQKCVATFEEAAAAALSPEATAELIQQQTRTLQRQ